MEGRCESDCGGDEVYPATFGNEEKTGLKLDRRRRSWLRSSTRKGRVETKESKRRYATIAFFSEVHESGKIERR